MRSLCSLSLSFLVLFAASALGAAPAPTPTPTPSPMPTPLVVEARLARLPRAERCRDRRIVWVVARYRVEKVLSGQEVKAGDKLAVAQACPDHARGFSRWGRGDAGRLRAGDRHRLQLGPFAPSKRATVVDPFPQGETRYRALRTNALAAPARVLVTVKGPGRLHRFPFAKERVTVGSSSGADIRLALPSAPLQAEFVVEGDKLRVRPLGKARGLVLDGAVLAPEGRKITYLSRIVIGAYTLSASLLPTTPTRR